MVALVIIISLYVIIPCGLLLRRKAAIKQMKKESSVKELKHYIKFLRYISILYLVLLSIFIALQYIYLKFHTITFATCILSACVVPYFAILNILINIKPYIKNKKKETETEN